MSTSTEKRVISVALVGNPNTGKSTLFNAVSGLRQRIGNYPGVTVEKKVGLIKLGNADVELIDLPGTYSLAPQSPDEMVSIDVLLGRMQDLKPPDAIITIVDASNLERNLYLVSQVLELRRPTIVALNMSDVAKGRGIQIDVEKLQQRLGVPVVPMQANRRVGLDRIREVLQSVIEDDEYPKRDISSSVFPEEFQKEVSDLAERLTDRKLPLYLVERLLLDVTGYLSNTLLTGDDPIHDKLVAARGRLADAGYPVPAVESMARYGWVENTLDGVVRKPAQRPVTGSDKIDHIVTHKVWGTLIFVGLMLLVFRSVFSWAEPLMGAIEAVQGWLSGLVGGALANGALKSLLIDGVIAGVGGVLVFLPQIFILFFFIAILEDCGYMARAAYLMDKLMVRVGLSGKSFIPLLSSFACAIPGVMAARVIENRRDRLTTILVAPLMSCSARLPVYVLLIAAFIPQRDIAGGLLTLQGLTMFAMYSVGVLVAVVVALFLKKTILRGETPSFVMELPSYKLPSLRVVLHRMFDRGWAFVRRAGTLIFAVAIIVWAAAYYPRSPDSIDASKRQQLTEIESGIETATGNELAMLEGQKSDLENEIAGQYLQQSFLGRTGRAIEPLVRPLGWDWRIGCAAIASFPAREVVVGTLGVIYNLGSETDEESVALRDKLKSATWDGTDRPVFNIPVALSLMVFFALCAQCAATLAVIKRETGSWRWPIFTFVYMTALAYLGALLTYQIGWRLLA